MKISVVISTYNGEKFIEEQLKSIFKQTRQADEIVVFDDNSSDETFEIVQKISKSHPQVSFVLHKNKDNQGWQVNFRNAILAASGDLIFCADQDDIWLPGKIKEMSDVMEDHPDIEVLGADFDRADQDGKTISSRFLHKRDGLENELEKVYFDKRFMVTKSPGCNLCITKQIQYLFGSTCWDTFLPHDEFIWVMGELRGTAWMTDNVYMLHREHGNNVSVKPKMSGEERANALVALSESAQHYREVVDKIDCNSLQTRKIVTEFSDFLKLRVSFISSPTTKKFAELIKKMDYYYSKKSFACDIAQAIGILK